MARTGRFGRLPKAAPDLTSTIVSMLREYNAQVDQNYVNAWKNGGNVDGKPVNDTRFLNHLQSRRDELSKDDPLWTDWNNSLIEQKFGIGESKMNLAFKQGKASASQVSAFYRGELTKITPNSEFYRTVAGRAADWAKSAAAAGRSAARGRVQSGLQTKLDGVQAVFNDYEAARKVLTTAAQKANFIDGTQSIEQANALDMQRLFQMGVSYNGVPLTWQSFQRMSVGAYRAYDTEIGVYNQLGRGTKELITQKNAFLDHNLVAWNTIDDRAKAEEALAIHAQKVVEAAGNPDDILKADQEAASTINSIVNIASAVGGTAANDPLWIGELHEWQTVLAGGQPIGTGMSDTTKAIFDQHTTAASDAAKIAAGTAYYGQNLNGFGGPMKVVDYPPTVANDPFGRHGMPESMQQSVVTDKNGKTQVVWLAGQPISAAVVSQRMGDGSYFPIDPAGLAPNDFAAGIRSGLLKVEANTMTNVGYVFQGPTTTGGDTGTRRYGIVGANGKMTFTKDNPFVGSVFTTPDGTPFVAARTTGGFDPKTGVPIIDTASAIDPNISPTGLPLMSDATLSPDQLRNLSLSGKLTIDDQSMNEYNQHVVAGAVVSGIAGVAAQFAAGSWSGGVQSLLGTFGPAKGPGGATSGNAPPVMPALDQHSYAMLGPLAPYVGRQEPGIGAGALGPGVTAPAATGGPPPPPAVTGPPIPGITPPKAPPTPATTFKPPPIAPPTAPAFSLPAGMTPTVNPITGRVTGGTPVNQPGMTGEKQR